MTVQVRLAAAFAILCCAAPLASPQQQRPPVQGPTFRTAVTVVPVDVRVVDREGRAITDLKQDDFTILENNVPQTVAHFSTVTFSPDPEARTESPAWVGTPNTAVKAENRRVFLFVMGRGRHQDISKYVDALESFAGRLLPQDHVAFMAWNRATDFTTDHAAIRRTILKYRDEHNRIEMELNSWFSSLRGLYGGKGIPPHIQKMIDGVFVEAAALRPRTLPPSAVTESAQGQQDARRIAEAIQRNAELAERKAAGFNSLPDLDAALTAGSSGLNYDEYVAAMTETLHDAGNLYAAVGYLRFLAGEKHLIFVTSKGVTLPRQEGNASIARVAADARIALDMVQTGGVVGLPKPIPLPNGGFKLEPWTTTDQILNQHIEFKDMQLMTDRTGGQLMLLKTGEEAFRRLDDSLKFQYLLGYSPANPAVDRTFRKVTVRVNRPGARVIAREGYVAAEAPITLDRREMITFQRIRAAAEYAGTVDHLKVRPGRPAFTRTELAIDVTVDISRVKFELKDGRREATLDVAMFIGGEQDVPVGEATNRIELRYAEADFERARKQGATFRLTAPLRAPAKALKVVVYDHGADLVGTAVAEVHR